jgi:hypothetical protein
MPAAGLAQSGETAITGTSFRRSAERGFVPERSAIMNRGDRLASHEIRFAFSPPAAFPIDFQTFSCTAVRQAGLPFRFAFRNQSIPAGRTSSDTYFLIVPAMDIKGVACLVGDRSPDPSQIESR